MADLNGRIGVRIHRCRTYLRKWFPGTPVWIWSALFIVVIFTSNALSVRFFAETEFWFSFIKVAAIVLFILIGACAVFGVLPTWMSASTHSVGYMVFSLIGRSVDVLDGKTRRKLPV